MTATILMTEDEIAALRDITRRHSMPVVLYTLSDLLLELEDTQRDKGEEGEANQTVHENVLIAHLAERIHTERRRALLPTTR